MDKVGRKSNRNEDIRITMIYPRKSSFSHKLEIKNCSFKELYTQEINSKRIILVPLCNKIWLSPNSMKAWMIPWSPVCLIPFFEVNALCWYINLFWYGYKRYHLLNLLAVFNGQWLILVARLGKKYFLFVKLFLACS